MLFRRLTFLVALMLIYVAPQLVWSQVTATVSGTVKDAQTGNALPGANVLLVGTGLGASTDLEGHYSIANVPPGSYTLRVSYVGYNNEHVKVNVIGSSRVVEDLKLTPVGVKGEEVVVTAQASGQTAAVNQQLSSQNIVNVVSAARIRELPDQNAAESVGRLPGVFLVRSYGEGSQVSIRGLEPKYNQVQINGVEIPPNTIGSNQTTDRSVDMSMVSSDMLSGIELFKTVTPDMDAAVIGGTVDFQIREAAQALNGAPKIEMSAQGGYNDLQGTYDDYVISGTIEKRFMDNSLGILAQGTVSRRNLTADIFGASYGLQKSGSYSNPGPVVMNSINLQYKPTEKQLYNGTFTLDYKWSSGTVDWLNMLSRSTQSTSTFSQNYNISNGGITYGASQFTPINNFIMNIVNLKQNALSFKMDAKVSHAYTENINPGYWGVGFTQTVGNISGVNERQSPEAIAEQAAAYAIFDSTFLDGISTNSSFMRQRDIGASVDFQKDINISSLITVNVKFGGMYKYTFRSYDYADGSGTLLYPGDAGARQAVVRGMPWMMEPPYNFDTTGYARFPISMFFDPSQTFETFLGGHYTMLGKPTNLGVLIQLINLVIRSQQGQRAVTSGAYYPDTYGPVANRYHGNEYRNAVYLMATIRLGSEVTFIPGVRYQGLQTKYTAAYISAAYLGNTYPFPYPSSAYSDTTVTEYHGYWLPDVSLRYRPFSWFDIRLSYTNTISYPNFSDIVPQIRVYINTVDWNNYMLRPSRSQNYDVALSFYNNTIGLLEINPFLKRITDVVFPTGGFGITDPSLYPPIPSYTKGYTLSSTQINNPNPVNLWGVEAEWQTHFWYLPSVLSGLVMSVNYTRTFSEAKYPFTMVFPGSFPRYKTTYVDTFFISRLYDQPTELANLSLGYDYKGFSARVSMIYQSDVFTGNNWFAQLRQVKSKYIRWDISAKQKLPRLGLEIYLDVLNLNGEPDITVVQGNSYPNNEQSYGLTADFGLRYSF